MIEIQLTQGKVAIVDDIDSDLNNTKWYYSRYVVRKVGGRRNQTTVYLHRVILERRLGRELCDGEQVDHINKDVLDNRRSNIRLATNMENSHNRGVYSNNTSGYKGVYCAKSTGRWHAQIMIKGKRIHLGYFDTAELAHEAYKQAALKYHGDFARFE